jgi:hypothetical protein
MNHSCTMRIIIELLLRIQKICVKLSTRTGNPYLLDITEAYQCKPLAVVHELFEKGCIYLPCLIGTLTTKC